MFTKATEVLVLVGVFLLAGSAITQWIPDGHVEVGHDPPPPQTEWITVEVRNAGGVQGMARSATDFLRGAGFDVVSLGNADSFDQERSVVIDRVGEPTIARLVAEALGVDSVASAPDPELFVDVTVRLGSEWAPPRASRPDHLGGGSTRAPLRGVAPESEAGS